MKACTLLLSSLLIASCGGDKANSSSDPSTNTNATGQLPYGFSYSDTAAFGKTSVGVAGLGWVATVPDDPNKVGGSTHTQVGYTNLGGEFLLTFTPACTTYTDPNSKKDTTTCSAGSVQPPQLKMCDATLPQIAAPVLTVTGALNYSVYDLAPDEQSALNLQSAFLMANTNSGDPLQTGITLPDYAKRSAPCNGDSIAWGAPTAQFQLSAGGLQAATQTADANASHPWHSDDEVRAVARSGFISSRAGLYVGTHSVPNFDYKTATVPGYGGNADLIVDLDGTITGWLDFSNSWYPGDTSTWPTTYPAPITFSAQLADHIAAGGKTSFTVTPDASPWPNTTVTMEFFAEGASVSYQTADGSHSGTSKTSFHGLLPNAFTFYGYTAFPKYVFLLKNVSYTRPGHSAPESFVGNLVIGYDNKAQANFTQWPPLPYPGVDQEGWLNLAGTLDPTTNVVTLGWLQDLVAPQTPPPTKTPVTLQLDPNAITVGGTFVGYDGSPWTSLTLPGRRQ